MRNILIIPSRYSSLEVINFENRSNLLITSRKMASNHVAYEAYMYNCVANALQNLDEKIMPFCRAQSGLGAIYMRYATGRELVTGATPPLTWISKEEVLRRSNNTVDWSLYNKINPNKEFIIVVECVDADGRSHWKTMAFQDEPGPNDVGPLREYLTKKTETKCRNCAKRGAPIYRCRTCGVLSWYCNVTCRDMDAAHHAWLHHAGGSAPDT